MSEKKDLTEEQIEKVMRVVRENQNPDDRDPEEVIETKFNGDRKAYARVMARYHNISFS